MKHNLLDFSINRETKSVHLKRAFNGNLENVWDAWTTSELLDKWWAPKTFVNKTKVMDFREGGYWLYVMVSPDNEEYWGRSDYVKIEHHDSFSLYDSFCDKDGNINHKLPRSLCHYKFHENGNITTVDITLQYPKLEDLETTVNMGVEEGFASACDNLEELLEAQQAIV